MQYWYKPHTTDGPGPLRAHTATTVGNKVSHTISQLEKSFDTENIIIFGGGDGPNYFKDVWILDTGNILQSHASITLLFTSSVYRDE